MASWLTGPWCGTRASVPHGFYTRRQWQVGLVLRPCGAEQCEPPARSREQYGFAAGTDRFVTGPSIIVKRSHDVTLKSTDSIAE